MALNSRDREPAPAALSPAQRHRVGAGPKPGAVTAARVAAAVWAGPEPDCGSQREGRSLSHDQTQQPPAQSEGPPVPGEDPLGVRSDLPVPGEDPLGVSGDLPVPGEDPRGCVVTDEPEGLFSNRAGAGESHAEGVMAEQVSDKVGRLPGSGKP